MIRPVLLFFVMIVFAVACKKEDPEEKKENLPPVIQKLNCTPDERKAGIIYTLAVTASDPEGDLLQYLWAANDGIFTAPINSSQTKWQSPQDGSGKTFIISIKVSDGTSTAEKAFQIRLE